MTVLPEKFLSRFHGAIALMFSAMSMMRGLSAQVVENVESAPVVTEEQGGGQSETDPGNSRVHHLLKAIVIPSINFDNISLEDGMNYLQLRAAELDPIATKPDEAGVPIIVRPPRLLVLGQLPPIIRSLKIKDASLGTALKLACESAGYRYSVHHAKIVVEPLVSPVTPVPAAVAALPSQNHTSPPSAPVASSELSKTLSPLRIPDIQSARMVLTNLQQLADSNTGADKVAILQLATMIKNVFAADYQVATKITGVDQAEKDARHQEKIADEWRKPNTFGTINHEAAKAAMKKAGEIRKNARSELRDARDMLILRLRDADASIRIYEKKNDFNVVSTLATAVLAINQRSLHDGDYQPLYSREAIVELDRFIVTRNDCLARAGEAERSGRYESAIRFYAKARDQASRLRCANLLGAYLEESGLFGSALEYYEMAGNEEKVRLIRQFHPTLLPEHFKVLTADEIADKVAPCRVTVTHGNTSGSGFFIHRVGYILTNHHLIDQARNLQVKLDDGTSLPASIIATSAALNLAIIKVDGEQHPALELRSQEVKKGQPVFVLADPDNIKANVALHAGTIASTETKVNSTPVHVLDLPAYPDKSGSPLVDPTGRLIGIFTIRPSDSGQGKIIYSIPATIAQEFVLQHVK